MFVEAILTLKNSADHLQQYLKAAKIRAQDFESENIIGEFSKLLF